MSGLDDVRQRGRWWYAYLSQGEIWFPKGRPKLPITDMDERWRRNAAAWLLRQAKTIEFYYSAYEIDRDHEPMMVVIGEHPDGRVVERLDPEAYLAPAEGSMAGDAYERIFEERAERPEEWLKSTPLYKALIGETA
jgi:hypothetical protein